MANSRSEGDHSLDSFSSDSTSGYQAPPPPPPPSKALTIAFLVTFFLRVILVAAIFSLFAINIIIFTASKARYVGYVPPLEDPIWNKLNLTANPLSMLFQFFYYTNIPDEQINVILRNIEQLSGYVLLTMSCTYTFELFIMSPLILIGFFMAYKDARCSKMCSTIYAFLLVFPCFILYVIALIIMCMSHYFIVAYWVDFLFMIVLFVLNFMRINYLSTLLSRGYSKIQRSNAVEAERMIQPKKHAPMPEGQLRTDSDYQRLFVNNTASGYSMPGVSPTPSYYAAPPSSSGPPSSSAPPSSSGPPSSTGPGPPSSSGPPPPPPPYPSATTSMDTTVPSNTSSHQMSSMNTASSESAVRDMSSTNNAEKSSHIVEKTMTTTIIQQVPQVMKRRKSKKGKKSKKKKKKKSKKKK